MGTPGHGARVRQCASSDAFHVCGGFNRKGFVPTAGVFFISRRRSYNLVTRYASILGAQRAFDRAMSVGCRALGRSFLLIDWAAKIIQQSPEIQISEPWKVQFLKMLLQLSVSQDSFYSPFLHGKCAYGLECLIRLTCRILLSLADGCGVRHSLGECFGVLTPQYGGLFDRSCHSCTPLLVIGLQSYNKFLIYWFITAEIFLGRQGKTIETNLNRESYRTE